jgi:hypothetical protein
MHNHNQYTLFSELIKDIEIAVILLKFDLQASYYSIILNINIRNYLFKI